MLFIDASELLLAVMEIDGLEEAKQIYAFEYLRFFCYIDFDINWFGGVVYKLFKIIFVIGFFCEGVCTEMDEH